MCSSNGSIFSGMCRDMKPSLISEKSMLLVLAAVPFEITEALTSF